MRPRHLFILATVAVAAGVPSLADANPGDPYPNDRFQPPTGTPRVVTQAYIDRSRVELSAVFGAEYDTATVSKLHCFEPSFDRYDGESRACTFDFGTENVRRAGSVSYREYGPATFTVYLAPGHAFGLRQRPCRRPGPRRFRDRHWQVGRLASSDLYYRAPGCTDAARVLDRLASTSTIRLLRRSSTISIDSEYVGFGFDPSPWHCRSSGTGTSQLVRCRDDLDRTFTARLKRT